MSVTGTEKTSLVNGAENKGAATCTTAAHDIVGYATTKQQGVLEVNYMRSAKVGR